MALRTAGSVLVVFLWSVTVVLGQKGWSVTYTPQSICTLKGSTAELSCSYTYPSGTVTTTLWFTEWGTGTEPKNLGQDPKYAGRVDYHLDKKKVCNLKIRDLRESDSATYRFRLLTDQTGGKYSGSPGVTLPVTGLQVKVTGGHQDKTLTCITTCILTDNPTYIWYKNEHKVKEDTSSLYSDYLSDADSYSCAVKGHEDLSSPAVYGPRNTSVSVSPSGEIVEGRSVTLTCSSDANPPVQNCTWWYRKNGGHYQSISNQNTEPQHVFNEIKSSDTGEYYCEARNEMGTDRSESINIDVKYGSKNTSVSISPSGEIVEGSSVTLTCTSDANPPLDKYTWYKKNVTSPKASGQSYSINNIISEDKGEYYCEAQNGRGSMNSTALMIIVAGKQTSVLTAAVGIIVVVLVLILCLSGLMCFRKKASKSTSDTRDTSENVQGDSSPVYDNISGMAMAPTTAQTAATVDQDDVHYARVHVFHSENQEVPLYSTVQLLQPRKKEEDVQYAAVKFNLPSAAIW
ncbi:sialoadhesin [Salmo salar]|uniref:B-cell receptor CD22 n=1 Tax=Salmo salar TaxID=8030 RepID=A0A1S3QE81_SALSA|nr:sialoadhesin-like [Salmo salar]